MQIAKQWKIASQKYFIPGWAWGDLNHYLDLFCADANSIQKSSGVFLWDQACKTRSLNRGDFLWTRMLARSGWVVEKSCRVFHKWEKTLLYLFAQHMQQSSQESEQGNPQKARQQDKGTRQGNRAGQGKEADWGTSKSQWSNNCREWTLAKSIWKPSHKIWTVANINLQTTAEKQNPIVHATQFANKCKGPNTRPPKGVNVSQEPEDCIDSMGYIWTCSFWCVCMLHLNRRNAY